MSILVHAPGLAQQLPTPDSPKSQGSHSDLNEGFIATFRSLLEDIECSVISLSELHLSVLCCSYGRFPFYILDYEILPLFSVLLKIQGRTCLL